MGRDVRESYRQSSADSRRYQSAEEDHRGGSVHEVPASQTDSDVTESLANELLEYQQRVTFAGYDAEKARELDELADSRVEQVYPTIAGLADRLEQFEQSNAALRKDNAVLRGDRQSNPPRKPKYRGPRYALAVEPPDQSGGGRPVALKSPDVKRRVKSHCSRYIKRVSISHNRDDLERSNIAR